MVALNIISWNVRGLGGFEKKKRGVSVGEGEKSIHSMFTRNEVICV